MKVIHDHMPSPYKYETDYRKIPKHYLNTRIPQGRGMIKWQPFKTIPEQYQMLNQYAETQNQVQQPYLSEDQLHLLNHDVFQKLTRHDIAHVRYWKQGYIHEIQCYIQQVNTLKGVMVISNENGRDRLDIDLTAIVSVE